MSADPSHAFASLFGEKAVEDAAAWNQRRTELLQSWRKHLGAFPAEKPPLQTEIIATEQCEGFRRQLIRYQVEDGIFTNAYLLTPSPPAQQYPAVVAFHQTTRSNIKQVAGVDASIEELMQGVHLVRRGYVVLCPRCFIFEDDAYEAVGFARNAALMRERHPDWTGMTRMTWDAIRAVDLLESLPLVDRGRIGCIGHSLGAREALYGAAFDERYRAAVFNEGGINLRTSKWYPPWYLGDDARRPDYPLEHHQLLALISPRAFLLLAGNSIDTDESRALVEAARPVYRLLGAEGNLAWQNHHAGHRYPPEARTIAEAFLDLHLKAH